jgi:hypothetical protein
VRPSEIFQRTCWTSFEPVEASPAVLIDYFGQHKILWANAYPRPDGFFAGAPEMVRKKLKGPVGEYSAAGHGRRRQGILRFALILRGAGRPISTWRTAL